MSLRGVMSETRKTKLNSDARGENCAHCFDVKASPMLNRVEVTATTKLLVVLTIEKKHINRHKIYIYHFSFAKHSPRSLITLRCSPSISEPKGVYLWPKTKLNRMI